MQDGQEMNDDELQKAAREVLRTEGASQAEAAERLGVSRPAITMALNHSPASRYAATLRNIIQTYTGFSVETETETISVHRLKRSNR